jgi:hypothetical protein
MGYEPKITNLCFLINKKKKAKALKEKLPKRETKVERKNKGQIVLKIKNKYKNNWRI